MVDDLRATGMYLPIDSGKSLFAWTYEQGLLPQMVVIFGSPRGFVINCVAADRNMIGDGKELSIRGSHVSLLRYPSVIKGVQTGSIRTEGLATHMYPLTEQEKAPETAEHDSSAIKALLTLQPHNEPREVPIFADRTPTGG